MYIFFARLTFSLFAFVITSVSVAQEWQGEDYNLSMSGALINDHCGRVWQGGEYVSIHACNYHLANLFTVVVSTKHFEECAVTARGDIVMIADCMVERFNNWVAQQAQ